MRLAVCALADLEAEAERRRPAGVVSLLGPGQPLPPLAGDAERLVLRFNDIAEPRPGLVPPDRRMVGELLDFGAAAGDGPLLLHCWMGISRSPAAAFVLACALAEPGAEAGLARALRRASPTATPNRLFVALADEFLRRDGRMARAVEAIGRGCEAAARPFELDLSTARSSG